LEPCETTIVEEYIQDAKSWNIVYNELSTAR
jgi:hypothetical protein